VCRLLLAIPSFWCLPRHHSNNSPLFSVRSVPFRLDASPALLRTHADSPPLAFCPPLPPHFLFASFHGQLTQGEDAEGFQAGRDANPGRHRRCFEVCHSTSQPVGHRSRQRGVTPDLYPGLFAVDHPALKNVTKVLMSSATWCGDVALAAFLLSRS